MQRLFADKELQLHRASMLYITVNDALLTYYYTSKQMTYDFALKKISVPQMHGEIKEKLQLTR